MGDQREYRGYKDPKHCMECCEEECRKKCCPPPECPPDYPKCPPGCRPECQKPCNEGRSGIWLIILIVVIYLLFCNDNNGRGGLFGGLF